MADDFDFFSEQDKKDISYRACVGGMTLTGVALGSLAGGQAVAGGAAGLIWGLLTCKALSVPIRKKLFSANDKLKDHEIASILKIIRSKRPYIEKTNAIKLLAYVRSEVSGNPDKYKKILA